MCVCGGGGGGVLVNLGHGHFGLGRFGPAISATVNAKGGCFGHNVKLWVRGTATCMCAVHALCDEFSIYFLTCCLLPS